MSQPAPGPGATRAEGPAPGPGDRQRRTAAQHPVQRGHRLVRDQTTPPLPPGTAESVTTEVATVEGGVSR